MIMRDPQPTANAMIFQVRKRLDYVGTFELGVLDGMLQV